MFARRMPPTATQHDDVPWLQCRQGCSGAGDSEGVRRGPGSKRSASSALWRSRTCSGRSSQPPNTYTTAKCDPARRGSGQYGAQRCGQSHDTSRGGKQARGQSATGHLCSAPSVTSGSQTVLKRVYVSRVESGAAGCVTGESEGFRGDRKGGKIRACRKVTPSGPHCPLRPPSSGPRRAPSDRAGRKQGSAARRRKRGSLPHRRG